VSVVIPVFNQASFIEVAIESVLAQEYEPLELIVVDDGSTDDTPSRLSALGGRFTVLTQENRGASAALNRGIASSRGPLVCWLSADDRFLPGKIRRQVECFLEDPELGLVYTGYERIDAAGRVIADVSIQPPVHRDPFIAVFWQNSINGSSVMMRRPVFEVCGPFDESLRADVDADMWLKVATRFRIRRVDGAYLQYRIHPNTLSANRPLMAASMTEVRRRHILSGALRQRAASSDEHPSTLLAMIAADLAGQGLTDAAADVLAESREVGRHVPSQLLARLSIDLTRAAGANPALSVATRPLRSALSLARRRLSRQMTG
jgi:glycosyltransferase involved in cell wall biosynthesis